MLKDSMKYAKDDISRRMLAEQQVEAARVLESLHAALAKDGDLLNDDERGQIDATMANVAQLATGDDAEAIKQAIERLDEQTQDFAARRMDNSIRVAFKGQSIDNI